MSQICDDGSIFFKKWPISAHLSHSYNFGLRKDFSILFDILKDK